jgi:hypothetical protein
MQNKEPVAGTPISVPDDVSPSVGKAIGRFNSKMRELSEPEGEKVIDTVLDWMQRYRTGSIDRYSAQMLINAVRGKHYNFHSAESCGVEPAHKQRKIEELPEEESTESQRKRHVIELRRECIALGLKAIAWQERCDAMQSELSAARAEIEKFKEGRKGLRCAWCNWATEKIEDETERWAAMESHARICEKAPYARMLKERTALPEGAAVQFESLKLAERQLADIRSRVTVEMPCVAYEANDEGYCRQVDVHLAIAALTETIASLQPKEIAEGE